MINDIKVGNIMLSFEKGPQNEDTLILQVGCFPLDDKGDIIMSGFREITFRLESDAIPTELMLALSHLISWIKTHAPQKLVGILERDRQHYACRPFLDDCMQRLQMRAPSGPGGP